MRAAVWALALACVPPAAAAGQASSERGPSRASAPHERLAVFEGTWTLGETGEGPRFQETCAWLPEGRRHLVCRSRFWSEERAVEHMTVYSYDRADSTYVVTAFLAPGQVWRYVGGPQADRWVFDLQSDRADGPRIRTVVTVRPDTLHFIEEVSEDGGAWRTTENYRHVRVQGPAGVTTGGRSENSPRADNPTTAAYPGGACRLVPDICRESDTGSRYSARMQP